MVEAGSRRMLPMFPPKSSTAFPRQFESPTCWEKYLNCPCLVERNVRVIAPFSRYRIHSLCGTSVCSVSLWWTGSKQNQPQRHREHGGGTENFRLGHDRYTYELNFAK